MRFCPFRQKYLGKSVFSLPAGRQVLVRFLWISKENERKQLILKEFHIKKMHLMYSDNKNLSRTHVY